MTVSTIVSCENCQSRFDEKVASGICPRCGLLHSERPKLGLSEAVRLLLDIRELTGREVEIRRVDG